MNTNQQTQQPQQPQQSQQEPRQPSQPSSDLKETLTFRELEILALLAIGFSNRQLALAMSITDTTIESHLHHIFRKLCVTNRVQAARYAWDHKITWESVQKLAQANQNEKENE